MATGDYNDFIRNEWRRENEYRDRLYGEWNYTSTISPRMYIQDAVKNGLSVGDEIEITAAYYYNNVDTGIVLEIVVSRTGTGHIVVYTNGSNAIYSFPNTDYAIAIIKNSPDKQNKSGEPKKMISLNTMMKKLLDKDTQTLIKAGFINGDLQLTDEGWQNLKALLFEQNKDEMIKAAQEKLDEEKENKK